MRAVLFLICFYFTVKSFKNFNWNHGIFMRAFLWSTLTSSFLVLMSMRLQNALLSFSTSQLLLILWQMPWGEKLLCMSCPLLYTSLFSSFLLSQVPVVLDVFCWLQTYFKILYPWSLAIFIKMDSLIQPNSPLWAAEISTTFEDDVSTSEIWDGLMVFTTHRIYQHVNFPLSLISEWNKIQY